MSEESEWHRLVCGHEVRNPNAVHYCSYIDVVRVAAPPNLHSGDGRGHLDEYQFVRVHQVCELAFDEMRNELQRAIDATQASEYTGAARLVERLIAWLKVLHPTVRTLKTMRPEDFDAFRAFLAPASGLESHQFREVEILSGLRPDSPYATLRRESTTVTVRYREMLERASGNTRLWTAQMIALAREASLRSAFDAALARAGCSSVRELYRRRGSQDSLRALADTLYRYDREFLTHRQVHLDVVQEQFTGLAALEQAHKQGSLDAEPAVSAEAVRGTAEQGAHQPQETLAIPYLKGVIATARFFPELWALKQEREQDRARGPWNT